MSSVILSINVTERGEDEGPRIYIASCAKFGVRGDGDTVIKALSKAVSELKRYAFQAAIDEEVSTQASLDLDGKKGGRRKKAKKENGATDIDAAGA
ncbi:MAG: hypothetical protein ACRD4T_00015 [Candidatus Acidiferrales bacterium]